MREWLRYWRLVVQRAWQRSWTAIVGQTLATILRDALLLGAASLMLIYLEPTLAEMRAPTNVNESVFEVALWAVVSFILGTAALSTYFFVEVLFFTPLVLWKEQRTNAEASAAAAALAGNEMVQLKRREVEAIEEQTSELRLARQESHPWALAAKERDLQNARLGPIDIQDSQG